MLTSKEVFNSSPPHDFIAFFMFGSTLTPKLRGLRSKGVEAGTTIAKEDLQETNGDVSARFRNVGWALTKIKYFWTVIYFTAAGPTAGALCHDKDHKAKTEPASLVVINSLDI